MIPPKTVQEVLDAVKIEEVVGDFVALRRRGVNMLGLCPFHNEKTPSFNVNPTRNIFKCFGCGKAGDAVTFLQEHENFTFSDAIRWLARKYGIEIQEVERTPEQMAEQQLSDSLYIVNEFAQKHFSEQMFLTDEGKSVALDYFRRRGLREETIRTFGLGYAPEQRDLLLRRAQTEKYSVELLKQTGLCSQDGARDFFRARVMFPIHNLSGKVAAFAGRTLSREKSVPKYVNSPETAIYIKNKILYGAFQAKNAIRKQDECILVEGYMDVISLHQAGIENVVASSGTSLTEGQLQLIKRNTPNLKILYDGDPAGIKAALRGLDLALEQDMNVKIVLLPEGEDPDTYVQKVGATAFEAYLQEESKDFILFKTGVLLAETKGDPIKKSTLLKDIVATVAKIPDPIKRSVYLKECAALLEIGEQVLLTETNKIITTVLRKKAEKEAKAPGAASDSADIAPNPEYPIPDPIFAPPSEKPMQRGDVFQERDIVRLLVQFGSQALKNPPMTVAEHVLADIEDLLGDFDNPLYGKIAQECRDLLLEGRPFDQHYFLQHPSREVNELAIDLLTSPWEMSENWEAKYQYPLQNQPAPELNFDNDARQALDRFKLRKLMKMCSVNLARVKSASEAGAIDDMMRYMKVQQKLQEARNKVAERLGTVVLG